MTLKRYWSILSALFLLGAVISEPFWSTASEEFRKNPSISEQKPLMAILSVQANKQVLINGDIALNGATVLNGWQIDTSDQVAATVEFGFGRILRIAPNTSLKTEFDESGNVKATIMKGCAVLTDAKNLARELTTRWETSPVIDSTKNQPAMFCSPQSSWEVNLPTENAGGSLLKFTRAAIGALITGHLALSDNMVNDDRSANPGPSTP